MSGTDRKPPASSSTSSRDSAPPQLQMSRGSPFGQKGRSVSLYVQPPPKSAPCRPSPRAEVEAPRRRSINCPSNDKLLLVGYFITNDPEKVLYVDDLLAKFKDREADLCSKLLKRYGDYPRLSSVLNTKIIASVAGNLPIDNDISYSESLITAPASYRKKNIDITKITVKHWRVLVTDLLSLERDSVLNMKNFRYALSKLLHAGEHLSITSSELNLLILCQEAVMHSMGDYDRYSELSRRCTELQEMNTLLRLELDALASGDQTQVHSAFSVLADKYRGLVTENEVMKAELTDLYSNTPEGADMKYRAERELRLGVEEELRGAYSALMMEVLRPDSDKGQRKQVDEKQLQLVQGQLQKTQKQLEASEKDRTRLKVETDQTMSRLNEERQALKALMEEKNRLISTLQSEMRELTHSLDGFFSDGDGLSVTSPSESPSASSASGPALDGGIRVGGSSLNSISRENERTKASIQRTIAHHREHLQKLKTKLETQTGAIVESQGAIQELQTELTKKQSEVATLQKRSRKLETSLSKVTQESESKLSSALDQGSQAERGLKQRIEGLEETLSELRSHLEESQSSQRERERESLQLTESLSRANSSFQEQQTRARDLEKRLSETERQLCEQTMASGTTTRELGVELEQVRTQLTELQQEIVSLQEVSRLFELEMLGKLHTLEVLNSQLFGVPLLPASESAMGSPLRATAAGSAGSPITSPLSHSLSRSFDCPSMSSGVSGASSVLQRYDSMIAEFAQRAQTFAREHVTLDKSASVLKERYEDVCRALEESRASGLSLQSELTTVRASLAEVERDRSSLKQQHLEVQASVRSVTQEHAAVQRELSSVQTQLLECEGELESAQQTAIALTSKLESLREEHSSVSMEAQTLGERVRVMERSLSSTQDEARSTVESLRAVTKERDEAREATTKLKEAHAALGERFRALEVEHKHLEQRATELQSESAMSHRELSEKLRTLETELVAQRSEAQSLSTEKQQLTTEARQLTTETQSLSMERQKLASEKKKLETQLSQVQQQQAASEASLRAVSERSKELEGRVRAQETEARQATVQLQESRSQTQRLSEERESLSQRLTALTESYHALDGQRKVLETESRFLVGRVDVLEAEKAKQEAALLSLQSAQETQQTQLSEARVELSKRETVLDHLRKAAEQQDSALQRSVAEVTALREQVSSLREAHGPCLSIIEHLRMELASSTSSLQEKIQEVESLESELEAYQTSSGKAVGEQRREADRLESEVQSLRHQTSSLEESVRLKEVALQQQHDRLLSIMELKGSLAARVESLTAELEKQREAEARDSTAQTQAQAELLQRVESLTKERDAQSRECGLLRQRQETLEAQLSVQREEQQALQQRQSESEKRVAAVSEERNELKSELVGATKELQFAQERVAGLELEVAELEEKQKCEARARQETESRLMELQQECKVLRAQFDQYQRDLGARDGALQEERKRSSKLQSEVQALEMLSRELKTAAARAKEAEEEMRSLRSSAASQRQEAQSLALERTELRQEVDRLRQEIARGAAELGDDAGTPYSASMRRTLNEALEARADLQSRVREMERERDSREALLRDLEASEARARSERARLEESHGLLSVELKRAQLQGEQREKEARQRASEQEDLRTQLGSMQEQLKKRDSGDSPFCQILMSEKESMRQEAVRLRERVGEYKRVQAETTKRLTQLEERDAQRSDLLDSLHTQLESQRQSWQPKESAYKTLIDSLEGSLEEQKQRLAELTSALEARASKLQAERARIESLEREQAKSRQSWEEERRLLESSVSEWRVRAEERERSLEEQRQVSEHQEEEVKRYHALLTRSHIQLDEIATSLEETKTMCTRKGQEDQAQRERLGSYHQGAESAAQLAFLLDREQLSVGELRDQLLAREQELQRARQELQRARAQSQKLAQSLKDLVAQNTSLDGLLPTTQSGTLPQDRSVDRSENSLTFSELNSTHMDAWRRSAESRRWESLNVRTNTAHSAASAPRERRDASLFPMMQRTRDNLVHLLDAYDYLRSEHEEVTADLAQLEEEHAALRLRCEAQQGALARGAPQEREEAGPSPGLSELGEVPEVAEGSEEEGGAAVPAPYYPSEQWQFDLSVFLDEDVGDVKVLYRVYTRFYHLLSIAEYVELPRHEKRMCACLLNLLQSYYDVQQRIDHLEHYPPFQAPPEADLMAEVRALLRSVQRDGVEEEAEEVEGEEEEEEEEPMDPPPSLYT